MVFAGCFPGGTKTAFQSCMKTSQIGFVFLLTLSLATVGYVLYRYANKNKFEPMISKAIPKIQKVEEPQISLIQRAIAPLADFKAPKADMFVLKSIATPIRSRCLKSICKGYYFTGDLTGYSWSANRKGIVRPYYASFRRENQQVVVQIAQIYSDGSILTKSYEVNHPELVVSSKSLLRVSELALETRKIQYAKLRD